MTESSSKMASTAIDATGRVSLDADGLRMASIENRRPMLIAANTGISAHIDGSGRILLRVPKRQAQVLVAKVQPDGRRSLYLLFGDLPAIACTAVCGLLIGIGLLRKRGQ